MKIRRSEAPSYIIFSLVVAFIIFGLLFGVLPALDKLKKEYPYSDDLKNGTKVYLDIIDLNPVYTAGATLICKCHFLDGSEVWMLLNSSEYKSFEGAEESWLGSMLTYSALSFNEPVRVHGKIRDSDDMPYKDLEKKINSPTIVLFQSLQ